LRDLPNKVKNTLIRSSKMKIVSFQILVEIGGIALIQLQLIGPIIVLEKYIYQTEAWG